MFSLFLAVNTSALVENGRSYVLKDDIILLTNGVAKWEKLFWVPLILKERVSLIFSIENVK